MSVICDINVIVLATVYYDHCFVFFSQLGMVNVDAVLGGMRNDHSSTVKKPCFTSKNQNNKTGQVRRPSNGNSQEPPAKVTLVVYCVDSNKFI